MDVDHQRLSAYVQFSDHAGKLDEIELVPGQPKIRLDDWSNDEKRQVETLLEQVIKRAPGLLLAATTGGKIAICRVGRNEIQKRNTAASGAGFLFLGNDFFASPDKFHIIVHELVHISDCGGRICYSIARAKFAGPQIEKVRHALISRTNRSNVPNSQTKSALSAWPSAAACGSLSEALAEYTSCYVSGEDLPLNEAIIDHCCRPLLEADKMQTDFSKYFQLGISAFFQRRFDEAITCFERCENIDPKSPRPHACIAWCYFYLGDSQKDLRETELAEARFKSIGVRKSQYEMLPRW